MTTMFSPDQAREALAGANDKRLALTALRKRLKAGEVTLTDVMDDPPACMVHLPLFRVILDCKGQGIDSLKRLNETAISARVNLAVTLGRASPRTRTFVATHARGAGAMSSSFVDPFITTSRPTHLRTIPNDPLREEFLRSGLNPWEASRTAGFRNLREFERALGIVGGRRTVRVPIAARIAQTLGFDQHKVGL